MISNSNFNQVFTRLLALFVFWMLSSTASSNPAASSVPVLVADHLINTHSIVEKQINNLIASLDESKSSSQSTRYDETEFYKIFTRDSVTLDKTVLRMDDDPDKRYDVKCLLPHIPDSIFLLLSFDKLDDESMSKIERAYNLYFPLYQKYLTALNNVEGARKTTFSIGGFQLLDNVGKTSCLTNALSKKSVPANWVFPYFFGYTGQIDWESYFSTTVRKGESLIMDAQWDRSLSQRQLAFNYRLLTETTGDLPNPLEGYPITDVSNHLFTIKEEAFSMLQYSIQGRDFTGPRQYLMTLEDFKSLDNYIKGFLINIEGDIKGTSSSMFSRAANDPVSRVKLGLRYLISEDR